MKILKKYFKDYDVNVELLIGSMTPKEKEDVQTRLREGQIDMIVGTHALIQKGVEFKEIKYMGVNDNLLDYRLYITDNRL